MPFIGGQLKRAQAELVSGLPDLEGILQGRLLYDFNTQSFYVQTSSGYSKALLNGSAISLGENDITLNLSPGIMRVLGTTGTRTGQLDFRVLNIQGSPGAAGLRVGEAGRLFLDTNDNVFWYDTGTEFRQLGTSTTTNIPGGSPGGTAVDFGPVNSRIDTLVTRLDTLDGLVEGLQGQIFGIGGESPSHRITLNSGITSALTGLVLDKDVNSGYQVNYSFVMTDSDDTIAESGTAYFSYINNGWSVSVVASTFDLDPTSEDKISEFTVASDGQVNIAVAAISETGDSSFQGHLSWSVAAVFPNTAGVGVVNLVDTQAAQRLDGFALNHEIAGGYHLSYQILIYSFTEVSDKVASGKIYASYISGEWKVSSVASSVKGQSFGHKFIVQEEGDSRYIALLLQEGAIPLGGAGVLGNPGKIQFRLDTVFGVT